MKGKMEEIKEEKKNSIIEEEEDYRIGDYKINTGGKPPRDPRKPLTQREFEMERAFSLIRNMKKYSEEPMLQDLEPYRDTSDFYRNKNDICVICGLPCKSGLNCMECQMPERSKMRADTVFHGTLASHKKE